jgi:hypothetical protein
MRRLLFCFILIFALPLAGQATELSGKKAQDYIGNLSERVRKNSYSVILLERRNRDTITDAELDGIIFNPLGDKYHYIRRLDDEHSLKLNVTDGRQASLVSPNNISEYETLIKENKLDPHVILDKDGKELGIIYCSLKNQITWSKNKKGEILLEVKDVFKREELMFPLNKSFLNNKE